MTRRTLFASFVLAACSGSQRAPQTAPPAPRHEIAAPSTAPAPSAPSDWRASLQNPASRGRAIAELRRRYDDRMVRAGGNHADPNVRALVDQIALPLTSVYVDQYDALDVPTRVELIKLLADLRDPRTAPALKTALERFSHQPDVGKEASDVKWAARAVHDLKLEALADALFAAFSKLRASTPVGSIAYRDVLEAMLQMPQKSWVSPMIDSLKTNIVRPTDARDKAAIDAYRDQLFWQVSAAQMLGRLRAVEAVEPLAKLILEPAKVDIHATAIHALVQIGKPAVAPAVELLKHPEHQAMAAIMLGAIGRKEAILPLINASKTAPASNKAIIARELTRLPANAASKAAFKTAFESIPAQTTIPPGIVALDVLAESATEFYDPKMIDWLLQRAEKTKGSADDLEGMRGAIVVSIIKLAKPDQMSKVKLAVDKWGAQLEKNLFAQAEQLVTRCRENASCYLEAMASRDNQDQNRQWVAIKAGYMLAIFGNQSTRDEIVARLGRLENPAVRFVAARAIDHLSPDGAKQAAAEIRELLQRDAERGDVQAKMSDAPLQEVVYRLEARAE